MSLSNEEQEKNIVLAVRLMMENFEEPYRGHDGQEHDATTEKFAGVRRTTWDKLVEKGWVEATSYDRYFLTGDGWIEGLKVTDQFDDCDFQKKAGLLCGALKAKITKGRKGTLTTCSEIAAETGLSEGFIYDAIDSHLIREMFNRTEATWSPDDQNKNYIDIPPGFGLPLL